MAKQYFLRFVNEDLCKQALEPVGMYSPPETDPDDPQRILQSGHYITAEHGWAMDPVGVIYEPGTYDEDGNELTPPTPLPGWHVNIASDLPVPSSLVPYILDPEPTTPHRVFAGG